MADFMKYIILVPDGAADHPIEELEDQTPLQAAFTPNMDYLATKGVLGLVNTIPQAMPPGSDVANLSLLGYNPKKYYSGRGSLEAASMGIKLKEGQYAFRLNLVTLDNKNMVDYSAGHISTEESKKLIRALKKHFQERFEIYPGVSYRHILIVDGDFSEVVCTPPHDIIGQPFEKHLPSGPEGYKLNEFMDEASAVLQKHPVNKKRKKDGKEVANNVWLWGQGKAVNLPQFSSKYGLDGALISAVDLIKGIGILAGLKVIEVEGATGYLDTNYLGKAEKAVEALDKLDFVFVHVEAPDEAGHSGIVKNKIEAIERFDKNVVGPVLNYVNKNRICKIMVVPDHATPLALRTHLADAVPFVIYSCEEIANKEKKFDEFSARESQLWISNGYELIDNFVRFTKI